METDNGKIVVEIKEEVIGQVGYDEIGAKNQYLAKILKKTLQNDTCCTFV